MNKNNEKENEKRADSPSLFRSSERSDYKLEPAKGLDILAGIISVIAAVIVWLYA